MGKVGMGVGNTPAGQFLENTSETTTFSQTAARTKHKLSHYTRDGQHAGRVRVRVRNHLPSPPSPKHRVIRILVRKGFGVLDALPLSFTLSTGEGAGLAFDHGKRCGLVMVRSVFAGETPTPPPRHTFGSCVEGMLLLWLHSQLFADLAVSQTQEMTC